MTIRQNILALIATLLAIVAFNVWLFGIETTSRPSAAMEGGK